MASSQSALLLLFLQSVTVLAQSDRGPLNTHLPPWVTLGAQVRFRAEGLTGAGFKEGNNQGYLLERYRLDLGLQPLGWLGVFGEFQDSRAAHRPHPDAGIKDRADIRQAYVRVGREDGWWDVKAGRQRLAFGSERVIGAGEWGNTARAFDAIRVGVHHKKDRIDFFSSSVVVNSTDTWDHHKDGEDLHGVCGSFGSWLAGAKVEPYLLRRTGLNRSWTYGLRTAGTAGPNWSYELEALGQKGHEWAGTAQVRRQFSDLPGKPTILGEANYASTNLDQLYPTNHGIYGVADQIGRRNTQNLRSGLWIQPRKWLTLKGEGHYFWLANARAGLYAASGALTVPAVAGGASHTDVGPEVDLLAELRLSRHYDIGAQFGHLFPGQFLKERNAGVGRTFCALFLDVHL